MFWEYFGNSENVKTFSIFFFSVINKLWCIIFENDSSSKEFMTMLYVSLILKRIKYIHALISSGLGMRSKEIRGGLHAQDIVSSGDWNLDTKLLFKTRNDGFSHQRIAFQVGDKMCCFRNGRESICDCVHHQFHSLQNTVSGKKWEGWCSGHTLRTARSLDHHVSKHSGLIYKFLANYKTKNLSTVLICYIF